MAFRTNKTPDLQEKSASGAIATFNTALAMPLVECKTEFMCTEIGTGEKSPSNPYTLVGVDEVGIQKSGQNIWNEQCVVGDISDEDGTDKFGSDRLRSVGYTSILPNHSYRTNVPFNSRLKIYYYDKQQTFLEYQSNKYSVQAFTTPANAYYMRFVVYPDYGTTYNHNISINADSTDTAYHPYISNTVTLIDLDGTRYGGYVDVVRKKGIITYIKRVFDGTQQLQSINFRPASDSSAWIFKAIELPDFIPVGYGVVGDFKCDKLRPRTYDYVYSTDTGHGESVALFYNNTNGSVVMRISDTTLRTEEAINDYLSQNNIEVVYRLNTPIEISLSDIPTLSTIIGNNSFASDSGSIELKFKDLDIAKRGNFREVFKLPS